VRRRACSRIVAPQLSIAPAATHVLMIAGSAAGRFILPCGIESLDKTETNCDVFELV